MLKIGIAIDKWKLPIFQKHLESNGYEYEEHPGVTEDTLLLKVLAESQDEVQAIAEAASLECRNIKNH